MSIYSINGNELAAVYDVTGNNLSPAYDISGEEIFGNQLTVMTFNVQNWTGINLPSRGIMGEIFDKYKPDIACFQEFTVNRFLGDYFAYAQTTPNAGNDSGKGIYSVRPVTNPSVHFYTTHNLKRNYFKSHINWGGKDIAVYTTHLDFGNLAYAVSQAEELLADAENEEYFIITGDFNVNITSASGEKYNQFAKLFIDAGYNLANWADFGFLPTWYGGATVGSNVEYIDNIITTPNIEITSVTIDQTKVLADTGLTLDHLPLVAKLRVN